MMEWAVTNVVGTPPFKFHETANDIDDIDSILYFLYGLLGDQYFMCLNCKNNFFPEPMKDLHSLAHAQI